MRNPLEKAVPSVTSKRWTVLPSLAALVLMAISMFQHMERVDMCLLQSIWIYIYVIHVWKDRWVVLLYLKE